MLKSLFSHAFMVFESHQFHPALPVRENCPVWLWRNSQTIDSDIRFGVCLWQSLKIRRVIFLTLNGIEWRLKIWFLMAKYTHWYQKGKQCQNSIVRDENACFPVYWNCLKIIFACKLNCLKQSLIWCHFHSTRMTTEEFLYPTHCLLKVCFWGYVHLRHSYGRIRHENH